MNRSKLLSQTLEVLLVPETERFEIIAFADSLRDEIVEA
jgi:hypothetical protein